MKSGGKHLISPLIEHKDAEKTGIEYQAGR